MSNKILAAGLRALALLGAAAFANAATPWSAETHQLTFGDFNADGKTDLLYIANEPSLPSGIALSDGNAPTVNHQSWASNYLGIPWHSGYYKPIVADYNGDGRSDILLQRQEQGDSYILIANSSGQFVAITQTIAFNMAGQIWTADGHRIVAGDFNGDGRRDLFLQANRTSDLNAVFLASATGTFSSAQQTWGNSYMGFQWSLLKAVVYAGDFNADGKADLFVQAKPDQVIVSYDVPFPVPAYRPNSFGIVNAKSLGAGGELFYGTALQIFSRNHLGLDWSAANFDVIVGNFNGTGGDDIFLQGRRSGLDNRMLLAQSGGQFTAGDALTDATLRTMTADQVKLHAANFDGTTPVGLYIQAKMASGSNEIAANITTGSVTRLPHDPNAMNVVVQGTAVGAIPGEFSVDPNGGAFYKIPIVVPPGVAKIQPSLGLAYSSRSGNGPLGVGWQLTGLSMIIRCPTTVAQDGFGNQDGADYDVNDAYCLDGQRLIAITGSNGSQNAKYRTEIETYQDIASTGTTPGNPDSFTVRDKNGLKMEFGTDYSGAADSRFELRRAGATGWNSVWAIKRIRDRFENFIEFRYDQESASLEFRPVEISYGSQYTGAKIVVGRVVFEYSDRFDTSEGFTVGGYKTSLTKRLQKISTFGRADPTVPGANDRVSQYYLNYEYSPTTNFSHLASIVLCDGGAGAVQRCLKGTTFQWQHGYRGFAESTVATGVDLGSTVDLKIFDIDGDGRNDYVYRHVDGNNVGTWLVRYASLVHSKATGSYIDSEIDTDQPDRAFPIDWNNDGYGDLVDSTASPGAGGAPAGNYNVLLGGPNGFLSTPLNTGLLAEGLTYKGLGTTVGDFDGDGRQDFIYTPTMANNGALFAGELRLRRYSSGTVNAGLHQGVLVTSSLAGGSPPPPQGSPLPWTLSARYAVGIDNPDSSDFKDESSIYTINFDNDGKDDVLVRAKICWGREYPADTWTEQCQFEYQVYSWNGSTMTLAWSVANGTTNVDTKLLKIGDYNGDGLTDVLSYGKGMNNVAGSGWRLDIGTGSKGLGIGAFQNVMAANSLPAASTCSDLQYTIFAVLGNGSYQNASCNSPGLVTLDDELLNSALPIDYNRDGYTDLMVARLGNWQIMPGGKDGYVQTFLDTGREARQPKRAMLVDDAADGIVDLLFPWGSDPQNNWHVQYGRGPAVTGVIESITDGFGAQTSIQYAPTTASTDQVNYVGTVYKGHTGFAEDFTSDNIDSINGFRKVQALVWPNAHLAGPIPVVYQYVADNGTGTPGSAGSGVRTTLQYWGLKVNRAGRGQLGFSEVKAWNDNSEIETRTRFAQKDFPFVGDVLVHEQRFRDQTTYANSLAAGADSSSLLFDYAGACEINHQCAQITPQANTLYNEGAAYTKVSNSVNLVAAKVRTMSGGKIYLKYVRRNTEDVHPVTNGNPGAIPYKRVVTEVLASANSTAQDESSAGTNAIDDWGNPGATRVTVTNGTSGGSALTRDEHITTTTGSYTNDEPNWCLSRLVSSTVKYTKPPTNATGNAHAAPEITRANTFTYASGEQCVLTSESDDSGVTKTYTYDAFGNIFAEKLTYSSIPANEVRIAGSYLAGTPGTFSSYVGTQGQFPTEARNALGHAESTIWDGRFGVPKSTTGPNGLTSTAEYDTFGRKTKETPIAALSSAFSQSSTFWCVNTGMCWDARSVFTVRTTSSDGSLGYTEYDRLGRAVSTHKVGYDGNWIAAETYFDALGRPYLASKAYKPATQSTRCWDFKSYDALGRVTSTWSSYASNECTSTVMSPSAVPTGGRQTQTTYDLITADGNSTKIVGNSSDTSAYATTRVGYTTTNVIDRVRFVRDELTSGGCPSNGGAIAANTTGCLQTEYDYDAQGNLTYTKQVGGLGVTTAAPLTTIETKAWFNNLGRKTQMADPDMGTWTYTYTMFGELNTQTDAKGQVTDFDYDRLGRMAYRIEKLFGGATETSTTFTYDTASMGVGKIASVTSSNGYNEWISYDSIGRFSRSKRQLDGAYYYIDQGYDYLGRPDVLKYPGSVAGDSSSGPESDSNRVRVRNNYNGYGFLESVQDVSSGTTYWRADAVDENGAVTQETLGNSRITKRYYDRATGFLGTIKTGSAANDSEVQNLEFGFDQAANLRLRKDLTAGVNAGNGIREEFEYDKLYRLKQMRQYKPASSPGPTVATENYSYDDFGNLLAKGTSYTNYCYVALGGGSDPCSGVSAIRPHAAKRIKLGATTRDYAFDANGNVTAATNAMYDSVTWNVANLPKRVSKGAKYSEFTYGADRARFKQYLYRAANDTETTLYVGALYERLTKVSGGTTTVEHTHYIAAGGKVVTLAKRTGTGAIWLRYPHRDHLGSIVALTNDSGALVERSGFDPWGKRTSFSTWSATTPGTFTAGGTGTGGLTDGVSSTKRGFTFHEHVEELGFIHMNGRIYDNEVGRFFSADPQIQFPLSTQGFNRYAYVANPLSYTDPSGFSINLGAVGNLLNAIGDVILTVGGSSGWGAVVGWLLKVVGGYLQAGGSTEAWLKWLAGSLLTYRISFGAGGASPSGGWGRATLTLGAKNVGEGPGGYGSLSAKVHPTIWHQESISKRIIYNQIRNTSARCLENAEASWKVRTIRLIPISSTTNSAYLLRERRH
jgi:RHS repeat-associated protein